MKNFKTIINEIGITNEAISLEKQGQKERLKNLKDLKNQGQVYIKTKGKKIDIDVAIERLEKRIKKIK